MKKIIKISSFIFMMMLSLLIFSGCDTLFGSPEEEDEDIVYTLDTGTYYSADGSYYEIELDNTSGYYTGDWSKYSASGYRLDAGSSIKILDGQLVLTASFAKEYYYDITGNNIFVDSEGTEYTTNKPPVGEIFELQEGIYIHSDTDWVEIKFNSGSSYDETISSVKDLEYSFYSGYGYSINNNLIISDSEDLENAILLSDSSLEMYGDVYTLSDEITLELQEGKYLCATAIGKTIELEYGKFTYTEGNGSVIGEYDISKDYIFSGEAGKILSSTTFEYEGNTFYLEGTPPPTSPGQIAHEIFGEYKSEDGEVTYTFSENRTVTWEYSSHGYTQSSNGIYIIVGNEIQIDYTGNGVDTLTLIDINTFTRWNETFRKVGSTGDSSGNNGGASSGTVCPTGTYRSPEGYYFEFLCPDGVGTYRYFDPSAVYPIIDLVSTGHFEINGSTVSFMHVSGTYSIIAIYDGTFYESDPDYFFFQNRTYRRQ